MRFKTPKFWYKRANTLGSILLIPLSLLYRAGHYIKLKTTKQHSAQLPVICIGNVTIGGSGKTPVCLALSNLLTKNNICTTPFFLTRGYGGSETGPRRIEDHDTVHSVGDEPLLLATHSNTMLSVNRPLGAKKAHDLGADIIIMDDGLQNLSLKKDITFLVIDGTRGLGNQQTLPAGPMREPFSMALKRSDAIIIIGKDVHNLKNRIPSHIPIFSAHIHPSNTGKLSLENKKFIAFAGIGLPEKFYTTLKENEVSILKTHDFPDHHLYKKQEIISLLKHTKKQDARLITTQKDYIRLPKDLQKQIYMYKITLKWDDESALLRFIKEKLKNTQA